jgi:SAM-dependent methyltransferase
MITFMKSKQDTNLFDQATDPEQYSKSATSWMADLDRQEKQREQFWSGIRPYIPAHCRSILDIGSGSGWSADKSKAIGVRTWVGIEPSSNHFELARKLHPQFEMEKKTFELYETNLHFDCILAIMVFSHIGNIPAAFKKIHDLLNPGGVFISVLSAFHEGKDRCERRGRKYEVEVIDDDQYIDKSIEGYGIADINRRPEYYVSKAEEAGLSLIKQDKIADSGYSAKDLLVFKRV